MKKFFLFAFCLGSLLCACNTLEPETNRNDSPDVSFRLGGVKPVILTKATEVDANSLSNSGFYVSASTGAAGSEAEVWTNVQFTQSGDVFLGGKQWPASYVNPYHFYAGNEVLSFSEDGAVMNVSADKDVVCAYLPQPTYKAVNDFVFKHIFGVIGNVNVSALDGYDISEVAIKVTPKVSGVYNIKAGYGETDGTGFSEVVSGQESVIASAVGDNANNLWLIPGSYELSVSWKASKDDYSETFVSNGLSVDIEGGAINKIIIGLTGESSEISFRISVEEFNENVINIGSVITPDDPGQEPSGDSGFAVGKFAGLEIASGDLYYDGTEYKIADSWNHDSYGIHHGKTTGSYYFTGNEMEELFESPSNAYIGEDEYICNTKDPLDGWRLPTNDELVSLFTSDSSVRPGSTVNGEANKHYVFVKISDITHAGKEGALGLLVFPDGKSITGRVLSGIDYRNQYGRIEIPDSEVTVLTEAELNVYLSAGCVFFANNGGYDYQYDEWGNPTSYLSSELHSLLRFYSGLTNNVLTCVAYVPSSAYSDSGLEDYYSVRLVRDTRKNKTFAGLKLAPGNLYFDGSQWSIDKSYRHHNSYLADVTEVNFGVSSGVASQYFNFEELGRLFEKSSFSSSDGDIDNLLNPLDGWRIPTREELNKILTTDSSIRPGSTVNGIPNQLMALTYFGDPGYEGYCAGILVFPDGEIINGESFEHIESEYELDEYLTQGCIYIPAMGFVEGGVWHSSYDSYYDAYSVASYWSNTLTEDNTSNVYVCNFAFGVLPSENVANRSACYAPVRLVHD